MKEQTRLEIKGAVYNMIDVIEAEAEYKKVKVGEIALQYLRLPEVNEITKRAATIIKARELIKQNPPRTRNGN